MEVDGGIRVKTKIDTEQTLDGLKKLEKEAEKTAQKITEAGKKVSTAFTGMSAKQLETAIAKANKELEKQIALRDELETKANSVQDSYKPMYADATSEKQRENIDEIAQAELAPINAKWDELNAKIKESRANINAMKSALDRTKKAEDDTTKSAEKKGKAEKDAAKSTKEAAKSAKQGKKTFKDWLKTALKLSASMFGIRAAYMVLRKAASAYLDQNEELKNQIDSIWNVLGTAIGPVVRQVVNWLTIAITYANEFIKSLTGVDLIAKSNAAALKKQADATKKASDAAKTLAGFDEINKISDSDTSGSSGDAVTPGVFQPADTSGFPAPSADAWSGFSDIINTIKGVFDGLRSTAEGFYFATSDWLATVDFTPLMTAFAGCTEALAPFVALIGGALLEVYQAVLLPLAGWAIEEAAPASIDAVRAALEALHAFFEPFLAGVQELWAAIQPVVEWVEDTVVEAINGVKSTYEQFADVFGERSEEIQNIISGIGDIVSAVWSVIEPALDVIKEHIWNVLSFIGDIIGSVIGAAIDVLSGLIDFIAGVFTGDWRRAWNGIKKIFVGIWNGIKSVIKGVINGILRGIESMVNGVIKGLNFMINALNKLSFDIPDWVPVVGGKKFGFNIKEIKEVKLPRLAQGGIVNNPGRGVPVIAGEAGSEAILPLTKNTEWMDMLADRLGRSSDGGNIVVQIMLNGKKIQEELIKLNRKRDFATNGGI